MSACGLCSTNVQQQVAVDQTPIARGPVDGSYTGKGVPHARGRGDFLPLGRRQLNPSFRTRRV